MTEKPKFTRLIMLSGGVDSTFLLAQALRETEDIVLVHHVHLINLEGRHSAEAHACKKIVEYCRTNYRDFIYTESTVDRSGLYAMGYDVITVASEAGIAATTIFSKPDAWPIFGCLGSIWKRRMTPQRKMTKSDSPLQEIRPLRDLRPIGSLISSQPLRRHVFPTRRQSTCGRSSNPNAS